MDVGGSRTSRVCKETLQQNRSTTNIFAYFPLESLSASTLTHSIKVRFTRRHASGRVELLGSACPQDGPHSTRAGRVSSFRVC